MELQDMLTELAAELGVPGAVAGIVLGDRTDIAVHGVTNLDHPLPVDEGTLFQFGSTGKTFTATALMVLAERGLLDLDAPVRTYVPELVLKDEDVAKAVTVLQLLNHTAGWSGDMILELGDGDDCLDLYLAKMADFDQVSPLGESVSYNNASLSLAGLVLARVHGTTYEQAVRDLVLTPLGLDHTYGFAKEIMTLRFASGHLRSEAGETTVARPWSLPRSGTPAGGWTATIGDQLSWARLHLGQVENELLSPESLQRMQVPTAHMPGSALGDAVGISWLLTDVSGSLVVSHGGSTIGQLSDFAMVPQRGFGFVCMTNCAPAGAELYGKLRTWALEHYLQITTEEPELADLSDEELAVYAGTYTSAVASLVLRVEDKRLVAAITVTDTTLISEGEDPKQPEIALAVVVGGQDRYTVPDGDAKGMRGYFGRDAAGAVDGINISGRHMSRQP